LVVKISQISENSLRVKSKCYEDTVDWRCPTLFEW